MKSILLSPLVAFLIYFGLVTIVTALAEVGSAPEGHMYAGLMHRYSLDDFYMLMGLLAQGGFVERGSMHVTSITQKGRSLAAQIEAHQRNESGGSK